MTDKINMKESKAIADILNKYLLIQQNNYGKPNNSLSKRKLKLIIKIKQLFEIIDDINNNITQLFQTDITLSLLTMIEQ
jgi:hypothetical protein